MFFDGERNRKTERRHIVIPLDDLADQLVDVAARLETFVGPMCHREKRGGERLRSHPFVQGDEITPIRPRNSRFSTCGIRGSGVLFMSMR